MNDEIDRSKSPFLGTWLLIAQTNHHPDGTSRPARGEDPVGVLMYDAAGYMSALLMRTDARAGEFTDRTRFSTVAQGFHAYFGTFQVDEAARTVTHTVLGSGYPAYVGTVQVRGYSFDEDDQGGDTLTLTVLPVEQGIRRVLLWRRAPVR